MESHYLESLERESSPSLSDMERQDYINQINSLQATIKNLLSMIDTLRQTLESVNASSKRNEEVVKKLSAQIEAYQKQIRNLEDRDKRHNKNTFGQKTHKAKKRVDEKRGRDQEKDDYDGNHDSSDVQQTEIPQNEEGNIDQTKVKSEHLDEKRGPVRAWREAIYGNNDLEALLQPAIATK